ncbi:MAG: hypothetical protein U0797_05035 [Gemmataceae bacterium]
MPSSCLNDLRTSMSGRGDRSLPSTGSASRAAAPLLDPAEHDRRQGEADEVVDQDLGLADVPGESQADPQVGKGFLEVVLGEVRAAAEADQVDQLPDHLHFAQGGVADRLDRHRLVVPVAPAHERRPPGEV